MRRGARFNFDCFRPKNERRRQAADFKFGATDRLSTILAVHMHNSKYWPLRGLERACDTKVTKVGHVLDGSSIKMFSGLLTTNNK